MVTQGGQFIKCKIINLNYSCWLGVAVTVSGNLSTKLGGMDSGCYYPSGTGFFDCCCCSGGGVLFVACNFDIIVCNVGLRIIQQ